MSNNNTLPPPNTLEGEYLAAILNELKALREERFAASKPDDGTIRVREQKEKKR